jgi:hypothetical protein
VRPHQAGPKVTNPYTVFRALCLPWPKITPEGYPPSPLFIRISPNGIRTGGVILLCGGLFPFPEGWRFASSVSSSTFFRFLLRFDVVACPAEPLEVAHVVCTPPGRDLGCGLALGGCFRLRSVGICGRVGSLPFALMPSIALLMFFCFRFPMPCVCPCPWVVGLGVGRGGVGCPGAGGA